MGEETLPASRTQLQSALEKINSKLHDIKKVTDSPFKTDGHLMYGKIWVSTNGTTMSANTMDIKKCKGSKPLIEAYAYLKQLKDSYEEAAKELGLTSYRPAEHMSRNIDDWLYDIKIRLAVVAYEEEVNKLNRAKVKLESFLTQEDRLALVLNELGLDD